MQMLFFRSKSKRKTPTFEQWLDINGYYYVKTKKNKPCFKSNLTRKLKKKYINDFSIL